MGLDAHAYKHAAFPLPLRPPEQRDEDVAFALDHCFGPLVLDSTSDQGVRRYHCAECGAVVRLTDVPAAGKMAHPRQEEGKKR